MTRGQNLANKLKEKEDLCHELESKHLSINKHTKEIQAFNFATKSLYAILQFMSVQSQKVHP